MRELSGQTPTNLAVLVAVAGAIGGACFWGGGFYHQAVHDSQTVAEDSKAVRELKVDVSDIKKNVAVIKVQLNQVIKARALSASLPNRYSWNLIQPQYGPAFRPGRSKGN